MVANVLLRYQMCHLSILMDERPCVFVNKPPFRRLGDRPKSWRDVSEENH